MASSSDQPAEPVIPDHAPPEPDNPVLRHLGWAPMWVEDSNAVWVVVGDPGDGKSRASLRAAESIWPDFSIDAVAGNIVEFMELVLDDSYGQGSVIVLEEGSVEANAYEWYSESNSVFRTVLETWRHQNRMAIINLPNFKSLDKGARRRTDVIIEMMEAKPWKGFSVAKPKQVEYNNIDDFFTTPFPVLEGKRHKRIRFKNPSPGLLEDYEALKEEYTSELNKELYETLVEESQASKQQEVSPKEIGEEIISVGVDAYIKSNPAGEYIDRNKIQLDYDVGDQVSKRVKTYLVEELDLDVM